LNKYFQKKLSVGKMQGGDEAMKELILEVEELEQRIAPGSASNGSS